MDLKSKHFTISPISYYRISYHFQANFASNVDKLITIEQQITTKTKYFCGNRIRISREHLSLLKQKNKSQKTY